MLSADLKTLLDDEQTAQPELRQLGVSDLGKAHKSLVGIANCGVPLDLLEGIFEELVVQLPSSPDPDLGLKNFERFMASSRSPMSLAALLVRDPSALAALLSIFSFSQALTELLIQDPEGFDLIRLTDGQPVAKEILQQELRSEISFDANPKTVKNRLRQFKQREILRIAYGDLVRKFEIEKTQQQLGYLADSISEVALDYCLNRMRNRFGVVRNNSGNEAGFALFGSQRLGTRNLDYSPLLSFVAIHEPAVEVDGKQKIKPAEYYDRLLDEFEDLLSEDNEFGNCYRVRFDKRVTRGARRATTIRETQKFYDQNATARDKLELVQTCFVCGDLQLDSQFKTFRKQVCFQGYFDPTNLAEMRSLKQGLRTHVPGEGNFRNIKTGPGGLHDLEFTVGFLQLLVGRNIPAAQHGDFYEVLFQLEKHEVITRQEFTRLKENYSFLRAVSHCLLLMSADATDVFPRDKSQVTRLQRQLVQHFQEQPDFDGLDKVVKTAEENVAILTHLLQSSEQSTDDLLKDFVLGAAPSDEAVQRELREIGFQNPEIAIKGILELAKERHRFISSSRCRYFLSAVIRDLLKQIVKTSEPEETLASLVVVSDSLGGKGTLWELFFHNRSYLELYVNLCGNTPYLAAILQSNPGMLDELMDSLTLQQEESLDDYRLELDLICRNSKDIQPIVLSFKNSKHLQIGVSQLLGRRSLRQVHAGLAAVADCSIEKIVKSEYDRLVEKHGLPRNRPTKDLCQFGVMIGGKVGALEPNYHSNVNFWIVFEAEGNTDAGRGQKSILNQQFFNLLSTRVAKILSQNGPQGRLYELEMPPAEFGDSSTFAISLADLKTKCNKRLGSAAAMMFLSQHRIVASDSQFVVTVEALMAEILNDSQLDEDSWNKSWRARVDQQKEASKFNLKRGEGGTLDVETVIQFLYVANFGQLDRETNSISMLKQLVKAEVVDQQSAQLLQDAYEQLKQIELMLRLMNLPRRHALPVMEDTDQSKDGEIPEPIAITGNDPLGSNGISTKSADGLIAVQQSRLATLMKYDRFDLLREDVEKYQKDNRRTVSKLIDEYFAKRKTS